MEARLPYTKNVMQPMRLHNSLCSQYSCYVALPDQIAPSLIQLNPTRSKFLTKPWSFFLSSPLTLDLSRFIITRAHLHVTLSFSTFDLFFALANFSLSLLLPFPLPFLSTSDLSMLFLRSFFSLHLQSPFSLSAFSVSALFLFIAALSPPLISLCPFHLHSRSLCYLSMPSLLLPFLHHWYLSLPLWSPLFALSSFTFSLCFIHFYPLHPLYSLLTPVSSLTFYLINSTSLFLSRLQHSSPNVSLSRPLPSFPHNPHMR